MRPGAGTGLAATRLSTAKPQAEDGWFWSAVTCHRCREATCRRRTTESAGLQRGVHGSRQRQRARVAEAAWKFDGDKSPAQKR